MTDERKDEAPAASADERPKRAGPTIDLDASEVSGDTHKDAGTKAGGQFLNRAREKVSVAGSRLRERAWPVLVALFGGAIAALLVVAALWAGGMIGEQQASVSPAQFNSVAANVGDLTTRLARVEANAGKAVARVADPALAGRTETLEKSLAAVREEAAGLRSQLSMMSTQLNDVKSATRDGAPSVVDLAPLDERLTRLEDAIKALAAERAKPAPLTADDMNVRRLVVANTLEAAVRRGEAFASALAAAKQLAANPAALAPLDPFAAKGIPSEASYLRDVVPVLQRIADAAASKQAPASANTSGNGMLDRLQAGVARLVRVERDAGSAAKDNPALAATSIRHDDLAAARQDVAKLPQASDPQLQAWIRSVDAREAALVAAQKFSAEALAAISKSGQ